MKFLSIILPAYNEEDNIEPVMAELMAVLPELEKRVERIECIFVDDGSSDSTRVKMLESKGRYPELNIRVIAMNKNWGLTAAMDAGFQHSSGDILATIDTDLQNDFADIPKLMDHLADADVAIGIRVDRQDGFVKRASSKIANAIRNKATNENIRDTGCSLKLYRAEFVSRIKLFTGLHRFLPTLLKMEGARVVQVPVNHRPRIHGTPKYHLFNRLTGPLMDLLAVRWMQKRHLGYTSEEVDK